MSHVPPGQPLSTRTSWTGRLYRLIRKELLEILRDRRTLATLFLMPLLLYPLLGIVFYQVLQGDKLGKLTKPTYNIGYQTQDEFDLIDPYLESGAQWLRQRRRLKSIDPKKPTALLDLPPNTVVHAGWKSLMSENLAEDVRNGGLDVGLRLSKRQSPEEMQRLGLDAEIEIIYREGSAHGKEAVRFIQLLLDAANQQNAIVQTHVLRRRHNMPVAEELKEPVQVKLNKVTNPSTRKGSWLASLIPLILILMTITGAVYPAIDLTAGERERGTLEMLIAAPIPRFSLLLAKYVTVLVVALLTALMNIVPMLITLLATGLAKELYAVGGWIQLSIQLVQVLGLLMLFTAFFSAVLLAMTSFARSFKEAQAYLIPLMLLALTPGMLSLLPGLELSGVLPYVPLMNIVLLARDILDGSAVWTTGLTVIGVTFVYGVLALMLAARVFGREAIVARKVRTSQRS